jgi:hypothetical protein
MARPLSSKAFAFSAIVLSLASALTTDANGSVAALDVSDPREVCECAAIAVTSAMTAVPVTPTTANFETNFPRRDIGFISTRLPVMESNWHRGREPHVPGRPPKPHYLPGGRAERARPWPPRR